MSDSTPLLTELTPAFLTAIHTNYPNLLQLNLSYHQITTLPPEFTVLGNLTDLDLSHNKLNDVHNIVSVLSQLPLTKLNLQANTVYEKNDANSINAYIIDSIATLHYLNGVQVRDSSASDIADLSASYDSSLDFSHSEYSESAATSYDASYNGDKHVFDSTLDQLMHQPTQQHASRPLNTTIDNYNAFGNIIASAATDGVTVAQTHSDNIQKQPHTGNQSALYNVNDTTAQSRHIYNHSISNVQAQPDNNDQLADEYHALQDNDTDTSQQLDTGDLKQVQSLETTADYSSNDQIDEIVFDTSLISPLLHTPNKRSSGAQPTDTVPPAAKAQTALHTADNSAELHAAQQQIQQLQAELHSTRAQLTDTEHQLQAATIQLQEHINTHTEQIQLLSGHSDATIQSLTTQLTEANAKLQAEQQLTATASQLQQQLAEQTQLLSESTQQLTVTQQYVAELEATNAQQLAQINTLKQTIDAVNTQFAAAQQQFSAQYTAQLTALQTQATALQTQLQFEQAAQQALNDKHALHIANIQNVHTDEVNALNTTIKQLTAQLDTVQQQLLQQQQQPVVNDNGANSRVVELESKLKQLKQLYAAYDKLAVPPSAANTALTDTLQQEKALLKIQLDSLQHVVDLQQKNLAVRYPSTELALTQWRQQVTSLYVQLKNVLTEYGSKEVQLKQQIAELKEQCTEHDSKYSVLQQLYTALQASNKLLHMQATTSVQRVSDAATMSYNQHTDALNKRIATLMSRLTQEHSKLANVKNSVHTQQARTQRTYNDRLAALQQQVEQQSQAASNEIKQLKSTVDTLTIQLRTAERNTAAETDRVLSANKHIEQLTAQMHDITQSSHKAMIDVATQHNDAVNKLNTKLAELNTQYTALQRTLSEHTATSDRTIAELNVQLAARQQRIDELQKQLQTLRDEHSTELRQLLKDNNVLQSELIKQSLHVQQHQHTHYQPRYSQSVDYTADSAYVRPQPKNASYIRIPDATLTVTQPQRTPALYNSTNTVHERKESVLDPALKSKIESLTKLSNTLLSE